MNSLRLTEVNPETVSLLESCFADAFLDRSVGELVPELVGEAFAGDDSEAAECTGRRFGPWRVLEPLGQGGMGRVFLVERSDGHYEMRAALKLLNDRGWPGLTARFDAERRILARLDHPHVARLLDGGTTEKGEPWLVMEHIEGVPIDAWCEEDHLGLRARLRLFLQVCDAVAHAHRHLVVHRDIKPGNVLIDPDGKARLLDFGIAELLAETGDNDTGAAVAALTPGYAAPEQIRGGPASTATDAYALGALLYRLSTGCAPFTEDGGDAGQTIRKTLNQPPTPPSSIVAEPRMARKLRGDLDAIILKALTKEPTARYSSAVELAGDIRRHLDDFPVAARPATPAVRFRKLVRRHRLGVATLVLGTTLAISSLLFALVRWQEAERERERAERVTAFLTELLAVGDPAGGDAFTLAADDLLRRAVAQAERELDGRPALQAAVFHEVGEILSRLGLQDEAREALEQAITLRRELAPRGSPDLVDSLLRFGYTFQHSPRSTEGVPPLREAVRLARGLYGEDDPRLADALLELGVYASRLVAVEDPRVEVDRIAADNLAEALHLYRRSYGETHAKVAETLQSMAFTREDPAERILLLERSVAIYESADPTSPGFAYALSDLGLAYEGQGRAEEAESKLRRSLGLLRTREDDDARVELTIANNLAGVLRDRGSHGEAVALYREVLASRERLLPRNDRARAFTLYGLGRSLVGLGEPSKAETHLREAAAILDGEGAVGLAAVARGWAAEALWAQGTGQEGRDLARVSYHALRDAWGDEHQETEAARERLKRMGIEGAALESAWAPLDLQEAD